MIVRDLIKLCGGAPRIAEESKRLNKAQPATYRVAGLKAIYKWAEGGIPQWHWPVVMKLSGVTETEIYQANRDLEKKAFNAKAGTGAQEHPKRRAHAREAAKAA